MVVTPKLEELLYAAGNAVASACMRFPIGDQVEIDFGLMEEHFAFEVQMPRVHSPWMCMITYCESMEMGEAPRAPGFVVHWCLGTASSLVKLALRDNTTECLDQVSHTVSVAIRALLESEAQLKPRH